MPYNYPVKFGKYLLTKRIAVGGMAELFLAKMVGIKGFEKTLALKKILPEFGEDEEFVELFVDEAKISVQLQHANIVQVFDFGEIDRSYYIAMEFVDGPNLKNLLKRCLKKKGFFPIELAVHAVLQVLKALDYAQRVTIGDKTLNLVHRDVSPQNILVSREGEVKITDFGIAKATIKLTKTQPGKIQGKFSYMSPEQAVGGDIDHRSDIFSLGIIFFEMLTGFKLYSGDDTTTKYARVRDAKIPPPSNYNKNIPHELEAIVLKMLAKKPEDRYQSASEIIKILTEYLYPSSTDLIAASFSNLVKELFPVPLSQEEELAIGKILEVEKDRSTQTDFRLIKKETDRIEEEPLLPGRKKPLTRVSVSAGTPSDRTRLFAKVALFLFIIGLAVFFFIKSTEKPVDKDAADKTDIARIPDETPVQPPATSIEATTTALIVTTTVEPQPAVKGKGPPKKPAVERPKEKPSPCPADMQFVDAGPFLFGSPTNDPDRDGIEDAERMIFAKPFCMDRYEFPNALGENPRTEVTFEEAAALCTMRSKRLCGEAEWEKGCKGKDSTRYPYGNFYDYKICNSQDERGNPQRIAQIGSHESCKSSYGIFDLSGNVSEWTKGSDGGAKQKGGSAKTPSYRARCASWREGPANMKDPFLGFRCCMEPKIGEKDVQQ